MIKTDQFALFVDHGQFLDLIFLQDLLGLFQVGAFRGGDQLFFRHYFADLLAFVVFEAEVAVGKDAYEGLCIIYDGDAADLILFHQFECVADRRLLMEGDRIDDQSALAALDLSHLLYLLIDAHILVEDADAAFPGKCHGQCSFGDGIHGGGEHGYVQGNSFCQFAADVNFAGEYLRKCR